MFVARFFRRDLAYLICLAWLARPAPVIITFAPPVVVALAALIPALTASLFTSLFASWFTSLFTTLFSALVSHFMRRLVAGCRSCPLILVGVFLVFELHEVGYI